MRFPRLTPRRLLRVLALLTGVGVAVAVCRPLLMSERDLDPAGDRQRLQGIWTATWGDARAGKTASIEVDGTTWTFHNPLPEDPEDRSSYKFLVDTRDVSNKVLRLVEWQGQGPPPPGHQAPRAYRYDLASDELILGGTSKTGHGLRYRRHKGEQ